MTDKSYNNYTSMTDLALSGMVGKFIRHHRLKKNRTQADLAYASGMSRSTLSLLENGEKVTLSSLLKVLRALDLLHIMDAFKVIEQISPIEMARLERKKRKRAKKNKLSSSQQISSEW